jgi:hypothetical protein
MNVAALGALGALLWAAAQPAVPGLDRQEVLVLNVKLELKRHQCEITSVVPDLVEREGIEVRRNQHVTWNVTNNCDDAVKVTVKNFRRCTTEACREFSGVKDPFDGGAETIRAVPRNGSRGIFRRVHGSRELAPSGYYKYDVKLSSGYELDPMLQIRE